MNKIFILDLGSGNSCNNDWYIVKEMIDTIAEIDKARKTTIKWQLFKSAGLNIPLDKRIFTNAYDYARKLGFQITSSVFDKDSLDFLLEFDIPFIKIANNPMSIVLVPYIPEDKLIIASTNKPDTNLIGMKNTKIMRCISQYPAKEDDYHFMFRAEDLKKGISDHTDNWNLFRIYNPEVYECHYVLKHDLKNPDGGLFSRTPDQLREVINEI